MIDVAKLELKYVQRFEDRHGRVRHYYRRPGFPRATLPGEVGSAEFMAAYADASVKDGEGVARTRTKPKTINALIVAYYLSNGFKKKLSAGTQHAYRGQIEKFRKAHGEKSALMIQPIHFNAIFEDLAADAPAQTANLRKRLRAVFQVAVRLGWRHDNPVRETDKIDYETIGHIPWSEDDIVQFREFWGEGSKPAIALTVFLTTGVRRSDAHTIGRQHVRNGKVSVTQAKGGARLVIPAHPDLLALVESLPPGQMTFILTQYGKPYSRAGLTNWFSECARKAGLEDRTPHGLRKAVGRRLAEAGCSEKQIASVLGHTDPNTAKIYTKDADQARLASDAMGKMSANEERLASTPFDNRASGT